LFSASGNYKIYDAKLKTAMIC